MRRFTAFLVLAALVVALGPAPVRAQDGKYERYELGVEIGTFDHVTVFDVAGGSKTYYYLPLKITNDTGKERDVVIHVKATTDSQEWVKDDSEEGGRLEPRTYVGSTDPAALKALRKKLRKPELLALTDLSGKIAPGASKDGVAIFHNLDPEMDRMDVRIYGLVDPIDDRGTVKAVERKALSLKYERLGDEVRHTEDLLRLMKKEWVVESRRELPRRD